MCVMSSHLIKAGEASGDSQGRRQQEYAVKLEKIPNTCSLGIDNTSHHLAVVLGTQAAGKSLNVFIIVVWLPRITI